MLDKIIGNESIKNDLLKLKNQIPPVMIFNGPSKVGKIFTAYNFIDEIYKLGNRLTIHPDIRILESDTSVFKVELINKLKESLTYTPFELNRKFYLLRNIDMMNKESFNRILKVLEDRNETDYFILTSKNLNVIPLTVISRSVVFNFTPVQNLEKNFPQLSDLQIKLMMGCPGNLSLIEKLDLTNLYEIVKNLFKSIRKLTYSEILEEYSKLKTVNIWILINLMNIVSLDMMFLEGLSALKKLKLDLEGAILSEIHIKNMLLSLKG